MDSFTAEQRSAIMRRVKGKDTAPEMAVRRALRPAAVGYRLGGCGLPGRSDVVMKGRRLAVFVHGCFWHGHDCARGARQPKANADYWRAKIDRNRARDRDAEGRLTASGWRYEVVWECDLRRQDWSARLLEVVQATAATASSSTSAEASDRTCDRAPSSDPGVRGLETK